MLLQTHGMGGTVFQCCMGILTRATVYATGRGRALNYNVIGFITKVDETAFTTRLTDLQDMRDAAR
jgi:hypothetical protein